MNVVIEREKLGWTPVPENNNNGDKLEVAYPVNAGFNPDRFDVSSLAVVDFEQNSVYIA